MNIWAWVEKVQADLRDNGRERLADLMDLVPHYMSENMHERLDAVMPEALALAREAKNPWIEVYLRHWNLQSAVLQRYLVRANLGEAVSLIELANREDTRDCPQSVCTTQDLASCYAQLDGPAYVKERLSVASETLGRINAEWPCFTCISGEYATALIDDGRASEAIDFIEKQRTELVRIGKASRRDDMCGTEVDALIMLGRLEDALELNDRASESHRGSSFQEFRKLDRARILARLGRTEEAKEALLPFELVVRTQSQYEPWTDAVVHLAQAGAYENDWKLGAQLARFVREMRKNGVMRRAISIAHAAAKLALARGRPEAAEKIADQIEEMIPELRAPLGAPEELAKLREELARAPKSSSQIFPNATALLLALGDDPEADRILLERGRRAWPDDPNIIGPLSTALIQLGEDDAAVRVLERHVVAHPDDHEIVHLLAQALRRLQRDRELEKLAGDVLARASNPDSISVCRWALALRDRERGDHASARAHLAKILEVKEEAVNTRMLLAEIERDEGHHEAALAHLDRLVQNSGGTGGPYDWDRMVVATILERWDVVRESAARVGFQLEGEGPIEVDGELCMIRIEEDDGRSVACYAVRTGPVTARIVDVALPSMPQHHADRVVFDAQPENDAPEPGQEEDHVWIYRAIRVLSAGNYRSFVLEGVHPGQEARIALKRKLAERACNLVDATAPDYTLVFEQDGEEVELGAFYGLLAVPRDADLRELAAMLARETAEFEHPLIWPELCEELGDEQEHARQSAIAERYRIRV